MTDEDRKFLKYYEGEVVKVVHTDGDETRAYKGVLIDETSNHLFVGESVDDSNPVSYGKHVVDRVEVQS
jgi:hypothetical protein